MMPKRLFIPIAGCIFLCTPMYIGALGQEAEPPPRVQPPTVSAGGEPDGDTTVAERQSVEELIRATIQTLDEAEDLRQNQASAAQLQSAFDEASQNVQLIQERDPANPWILFLRGRGYSLTGRPADAAEELRRFVETREGRNEWQAFRSLGDLFSENFPRLAKANYQKAATLKADEPDVLIGLSTCHLKFGETDEAVRFAREAVEADGRKAPRYVSHLASVLQEAERWDEALSEAESAMRLATKRVDDSPGLRGPLHELDAQYELLLDILQIRIGRREDTDVQDYLRFARHAREKARTAQRLALHDALFVVQLGIDAVGSDRPPALLEQYAILLAEVDRTDDAIATFEELLQYDPGNTAAAEWIQRLRPDVRGRISSDRSTPP